MNGLLRPTLWRRTLPRLLPIWQLGIAEGRWIGTSDATQAVTKEPETDLTKHLETKIKMGGGPISIAQYMREALTNPKFGFYMGRDVFGRSGDFVTSPDVCQVFGELLGIWSVLMWEQMGQPSKFKLIELGPGRGTLMADLLRGTQRTTSSQSVHSGESVDVSGFSSFVSALESVHLVELSAPLRQKQAETLKCLRTTRAPIEDHTKLSSSMTSAQIQWHSTVEEVPKSCPEIILGHEFLDALPVHQFIKSAHGWRERMVDLAEEEDPLHFRFVQAPSITPAAAILPAKRLSWMPQSQQDAIRELEVGSDMLALGIRLAQRISEVGGAALFIDYGQDRPYPWSVQGIRRHKRVHVLERPGETDVSAFIDFAALKHSVAESGANAVAHGPIEQRYLLKALGIDARMNQLIQNATEQQYQDLKSGYERLIGCEETGQAEGMGKLYKAIVITQKSSPIPTGFTPME